MSKIIDWHRVIEDGKADWERLCRYLGDEQTREERVKAARSPRWTAELEYRAAGRSPISSDEARALAETLGGEIEKMRRAALLGTVGQAPKEADSAEGYALTIDALHSAADVARQAALEDLLGALRKQLGSAPN